MKKRASGTVRGVPIPPQLVGILRGHIETFGTTNDGRLFRGQQQLGEPIKPSIYTHAWKQPWVIGLTSQQAASPAALRPAARSCVHVACGRVPVAEVAEVAERAERAVEVLLKVYARCLDGSPSTSNERIDRLFAQVR